MGTENGNVIGLTKIFDSGSPTVRWNLVLVAEGYRAVDLPTFITDAEAVRDQLLAEAPFNSPEIACAINIYRLDVESDDAGADKPNCDDGGGDGSTKDTYFDSTFCANGETQRLLSGDSGLVQTEVEALLPQWHQILVIVNDPERGGAGGSIGWTSNSSADWRDVAIHEIGHAAFGLADEYDYSDSDNDVYDGGEPGAPNVSAESDPALVKWSALVTANADNPTMESGDCTLDNVAPSPVAADIVGTFEGASTWHCGVYRPVFNCMMRTTSADFCPVCSQSIIQSMAPYALPAPSGDVSLSELTVDFNDVPEDLSVVRAAHFLVNSCFPVTFQLITPPVPPFVAESPVTMVAEPSGATPWSAYYRFRLSCDSIGAVVPQEVVIRCLETGEDFTVTLTGNCTPRVSVAAQLVFDQSGSMLDLTDEGRTKEQVLKDSASVFVDLLYDDNGIGINAYDHNPHEIMDIAIAGSAGSGGGRDDSLTEITNFSANPDGWTAIGDGIELAKEKLDEVVYDEKAMVVMTDGKETASQYIADVADTVVNQKVFAIGLGTAEQIQPSALEALTSATDGYLLMTGNITDDDSFLLSKYYLQILSGLNNNEVIFDPEGLVRPGAIERIPFNVVESDVEITGIVLARPAHVLQIALQAPDGTLIDASNASVESSKTTRSTFIRAGLPLLANDKKVHEGRWHLLIALDPQYDKRLSSVVRDTKNPNYQGVRYSASVHAYSNLRMEVNLHQNSLQPGAQVIVNAKLTEYGEVFQGYANVRAELIRPDGAKLELNMPAVDDEPGMYSVSLVANMSGIYRFRIIASGRTSDEIPFTREQLRTASVWQGGDNPSRPEDKPPGIDWCEFINCVLEKGVISKKLLKRLDANGLDIAALRKCFCRFSKSSLNSNKTIKANLILSRLQSVLKEYNGG